MMQQFNNTLRINHGGQADIFRTNFIETGDQLVLKMYKKRGLACINEREVVKKLQGYPYIAELVEIYSLPMSCNDIVITFKYYQNHSLFEYIGSEAYLQESLAKILLCQILYGLSCAHREGICHLDIKAENILIDDNFNVAIGDWGLAEMKEFIYDDDIYLSKERGSSGYMPPQMFRNSARSIQYNAIKADSWSVGATYFSTIFGRLPFSKDGPNGRNWYFNQFCRGGERGKQLFWNHHNFESSGIIVSNEAKQFFDYIFIEDENKRPTIDEILKHPYLNDINTICMEEEKFDIMNKIKSKIDLNRNLK
jgi:serine/threonine protein kinase